MAGPLARLQNNERLASAEYVGRLLTAASRRVQDGVPLLPELVFA
jgi:hypothetical protein